MLGFLRLCFLTWVILSEVLVTSTWFAFILPVR
jgi:hypothetical protein